MNKRGVSGLLSSFFSKKQAPKDCFVVLSSINAKDIMVKDVLCIQRGDKLTEAAHMMIGAHVSCLVVLEGEKPAGILTERDFIKKLSMEKDHSSDMIVNSVMTRQLFSVSPNSNLFEVQKIMRDHKFRKLLIVENDVLKGIVTQTDLCKVVHDLDMVYPKAPLVQEVMSKKVLAVEEDDKFLQAKKLMATKDIGSVIITSKDEIKGMFTEFDLVSEFFMNPNRLKNSFMKELMTSPVVCISPDFDLFQVNDLMLEHNFRRLPVVDGNKLLGIITQTDVAKHLYEFIERHKELTAEAPKKKGQTIYCVKKKGNIILYEKKKEQPKEK